MSVKIVVSATEEGERDEILEALDPVIKRKRYKVKKKPPALDGKLHYVAYVETRKSSCK